MSLFKFRIMLAVLCDWRIVKICYMQCFIVLSVSRELCFCCTILRLQNVWVSFFFLSFFIFLKLA